MAGTTSGVIKRPNGKPYRPRKVCAVIFSADSVAGGDCCGVIVLGTHDVDQARELAGPAMSHGWPVKPTRGWWRDGYDTYHDRAWIYDDYRGRAGVMFVCSDDPPDAQVTA